MKKEPFKKTKIVATIGPSTWDPEVMKSIIDTGLNVARVNGAFADIEELGRVAKLIRSFSTDVALMLDIKGHEIRLNKFDPDIKIKPGDEVIIGSSKKDKIYPITYPELYSNLKEGVTLLLDDGKVELEVKEIKNKKIYTKVINGSVIKYGKSINTPGTTLLNPPLTKKDIKQIKFCIKDGWDFVSASFIRNADDAKRVRKYLDKSHMKVIAKIEDSQGVENFDEILEEVEGIMVARGDLGIEIPFERVPELQKEFIRKCNEKGKPVITATHMLESMIESPRPTRAEISDVANAVLDGTDAIMLSGESSTGKYPVEAVETMRRIALETENDLTPSLIPGIPDAPEVTNALTKAAFEVATSLDIDSIIVVSKTGRTARLLGRFRITQPIYAFVSKDYYKRRMNLSKGVYPFTFPQTYKDRDHALNGIIKEVIKKGFVNKTDKVLVIGNAVTALTEKAYFPNIFEVVEIKEFLK